MHDIHGKWQRPKHPAEGLPTTTVTANAEDNDVLVHITANRSSFRMGRGVIQDGRNMLRQTNLMVIQPGDIATGDTGWGQRGIKIPPEEASELTKIGEAGGINAKASSMD